MSMSLKYMELKNDIVTAKDYEALKKIGKRKGSIQQKTQEELKHIK